MTALDDYSLEKLEALLIQYEDDTTGFKRQVVQEIKGRQIRSMKAAEAIA